MSSLKSLWYYAVCSDSPPVKQVVLKEKLNMCGRQDFVMFSEPISLETASRRIEQKLTCLYNGCVIFWYKTVIYCNCFMANLFCYAMSRNIWAFFSMRSRNAIFCTTRDAHLLDRFIKRRTLHLLSGRIKRYLSTCLVACGAE